MQEVEKRLHFVLWNSQTNLKEAMHESASPQKEPSDGSVEEGPVSLQSDSRDSSAHPTQYAVSGLDAAACQEFILAAAKAELEQQQQRRVLCGQSSGSDEAKIDASSPSESGSHLSPHSTDPAIIAKEDEKLSLSGVIADLLDLKPAAFHHDQDRCSVEFQTHNASQERDVIFHTQSQEHRENVIPSHHGLGGGHTTVTDGLHSRTSSGQMRRTNSGMSGRTSMESVMAACVGKVTQTAGTCSSLDCGTLHSF